MGVLEHFFRNRAAAEDEPSPKRRTRRPSNAGVESDAGEGRPVDKPSARGVLARALPKLPVDLRVPKVVGPADAILMAIVVGLIAFGVVMVYSASAVYAARTYDDGHRFLLRQSVFAVVGIVWMVTVAKIDYHRYRALTYPILAGAVGLLLFVVLGLGHTAGGASRWIQLGPVNIQPAETAKLAIILWLAYSLSKKAAEIRSFSVGFLPHILVSGFLMFLCLQQPDFGSAVMIGVLTAVMIFTAGGRFTYLLGAALLAIPMVVLLIATSPYRMRRMEAFSDPFAHRYDLGYQIAESLMSFGAGGVTGVGIGDSRQKLLFLPEAHTDFISAIIGEELGFIGICCLVLAFAAIIVRGLRAAFDAPNDYGTYIAVGITMFLGLQAYTNLAVAMGMVPTKGLVLPFLSYGGSSLLVNCTAVGVLLNVSRPREVEVREAQDEREVRAKTPRKRSRPARRLAGALPGGSS